MNNIVCRPMAHRTVYVGTCSHVFKLPIHVLELSLRALSEASCILVFAYLAKDSISTSVVPADLPS